MLPLQDFKVNALFVKSVVLYTKKNLNSSLFAFSSEEEGIKIFIVLSNIVLLSCKSM
jgi:hypothetical protein